MEEDPICKLSKGQRLRLCAVIFTMARLRRKYQFKANEDNIEGACRKKIISFKSRKAKKEAGKKVYEEFMIPCKLNSAKRKRRAPVNFYISRAYDHDKNFLFHERRGKVYPRLYIYNTGVIDT